MSNSKYFYKSNPLVDSIFWLSIVFYLDPGGFFSYYLSGRIFGSHYTFTLFIISYLCFFLRFQNGVELIFQKKIVLKYGIRISIWLLYYLLVFGWINTEYVNVPFGIITRGFRFVFQAFIVIPIIFFAMVNLKPFINILSWTSIIILILFFITVFSTSNLVQFMSGSRGFIDATRYLMFGYGLMYFLLTIAISYLFSKFKLNYTVLTGGILITLAIFISLTRRGIIGIFEYLLIISIIFNYVHHGKLLKGFTGLFTTRNLAFILVFLLFFSIMFSEYWEYSAKTIQEAFNVIIYGETSSGISDSRLSLFGKTGIVDAIQENFWIGTGFDPVWGTGDGGKNEWEGSDYIFLSTFAMYGIIGLLLFLPFYIIAIKVIRRFFKLVKNNLTTIYNNKNIFELPVIIGFAAAAEFIKNLIEYPNWFYPIGAVANSPLYFIYFGLLVGSYLSVQNRLIMLTSPTIK